jgi:hypothetical protein
LNEPRELNDNDDDDDLSPWIPTIESFNRFTRGFFRLDLFSITILETDVELS